MTRPKELKINSVNCQVDLPPVGLSVVWEILKQFTRSGFDSLGPFSIALLHKKDSVIGVHSFRDNIKNYSLFAFCFAWQIVHIVQPYLIKYVLYWLSVHSISTNYRTSELGTQQFCRNNVTMFSGHNIFIYCNICLATPCRHRDLNIFRFFFLSLRLYYVVALSLS